MGYGNRVLGARIRGLCWSGVRRRSQSGSPRRRTRRSRSPERVRGGSEGCAQRQGGRFARRRTPPSSLLWKRSWETLAAARERRRDSVRPIRIDREVLARITSERGQEVAFGPGDGDGHHPEQQRIRHRNVSHGAPAVARLVFHRGRSGSPGHRGGTGVWRRTIVISRLCPVARRRRCACGDWGPRANRKIGDVPIAVSGCGNVYCIGTKR